MYDTPHKKNIVIVIKENNKVLCLHRQVNDNLIDV